MELYYAREAIVHAARNAGIYCFDTAYADINNLEGFREEVQFIKDLGFDGKSCVHPKQIAIVHEIYTPTQKEIEKSIRIIMGAKEAERKEYGVISVDGKMVDGPIILRAYRVLELAKAAGIYKGVENEI